MTASELALARAWAEGDLPARLTTRAGIDVEVVYRGLWTHGFGPDFRDAMIAWPDGRLESGAVEIHLRTGGWREHGHHLDPAYNTVVLHVVGIDDGGETRRADGRLVPVVAVGLERAELAAAGFDWSRVGGEVCAADLSQRRPAAVVRALHALADTRLATMAAAFEAELTLHPPGQVLWSAILDAFGIAENRAPMRRVAALVPIAELEQALATTNDRLTLAAALLLGAAGFLPLTPRDAETSGLSPGQVMAIESRWLTERRPGDSVISPAEWQLTRVRPSNHPVVRLIAAAALAAGQKEGLTSSLLDGIRRKSFDQEALIGAIERGGGRLGADRAIVVASRVLIPFALALSEQIGDPELADGAMAAWDALPASSHNRQTRAGLLQVTGGPALRGLGERGMHGLIHLHRAFCTPRRCFECPVAALVVSDEAGPS